MQVQYLPFHVDSSFLLAFKRLWVGVWQYIITENNRLQGYFGLPHKFSTIMINAGSCPKYYFQNDKWLLNMEDKTSLYIKKTKQKTKSKNSSASISFTLLNLGDCTKHNQLSWELQSGRSSASSSADSLTSWPTRVARHPAAFFTVKRLLSVLYPSPSSNDLFWKWSTAAATGESFDWPSPGGFCVLIIQNCKITWFSSWVILQKWKLNSRKMH